MERMHRQQKNVKRCELEREGVGEGAEEEVRERRGEERRGGMRGEGR